MRRILTFIAYEQKHGDAYKVEYAQTRIFSEDPVPYAQGDMEGKLASVEQP